MITIGSTDYKLDCLIRVRIKVRKSDRKQGGNGYPSGYGAGGGHTYAQNGKV